MSRLLGLCANLFNLSGLLQQQDLVFAQYKDQILSEFDTLERNAFAKQYDVTSVQHVKYALAAFIDELVMHSNWQHRNRWMSNPLQHQFFGEHLAGEGFFTRLNTIRQEKSARFELLEVYYMCLQLGFQGVYRTQGLDKLMALQVDLRSQIDNVLGRINFELAREAIPKTGVVKKMSREIPLWVIGSVIAAVIFFIYLGFSLAIDNQAEQALAEIRKIFI